MSRRTKRRDGVAEMANDTVDELLAYDPKAPLTQAATTEGCVGRKPSDPMTPDEIRVYGVSLEVLLAQFRPEVRQFRHVEAQLDPRQGAVLRRLFDALDANHVRLANGRYVSTAADCIRWLLDQLDEKG